MLVVAASYAVLFGVLGVTNHLALRTQLHDLGHMEQSIWEVTQGRFSMPLSDPVPFKSRFFQHANVIFYLLAPLYALVPSPITLLILETLTVAAAGVALFFLADHLLGDRRLGLLFGVALLLNPMVQDANLYDFHPEVIACLLYLLALLCLETRRWWGYWVAVCLLLFLKEDMIAVVASLGIVTIVRVSRRRGWLTIGAALAYGAVICLVCWRALGVPLSGNEFVRFAYLFGQRSGTAAGTGARQAAWLARFTAKDCWYIVYVGVQGGFLAVFEPLWMLPAAPDVLLNLADRKLWQSNISGVYYSALVVTVVTVAGIYGFKRLRDASSPLARPLLGFFALQVAVIGYVFSPAPYGYFSSWRQFDSQIDREAFRQIAEQIPSDASLATQNNLGAQFAARSEIFEYPKDRGRAAYILFSIQNPVSRQRPRLFRRRPAMLLSFHKVQSLEYPDRVLSALMDPAYGVVSFREHFYLLKRGAPRTLNADALIAAREDLAAVLPRRRFPGWSRD
jgi:uncharacterized membrane protein